MVGANLGDQVEQAGLERGGYPDLVAQVPCESDPAHQGRDHAQCHGPDVQKPERLSVHVGFGDGGQQVTSGRPGNGQTG